MIKTIEFQGHTVVAPIVGKDRELIAPLEDYLPSEGWLWFMLADGRDTSISEEQLRKGWVRKRDGNCCLLCPNEVETNEVHEIVSKGAASAARALVPWNMITLCREHHRLLQEGIWKIYHFDPLDKEHGLIVIGADGHPVKKIWFYERPDPEMSAMCHEDYVWLEGWWRRRRGEEWEASVRLARLKDQSAWKHLGEKSHKALVAGAGADTVLCERLEKAMRQAIIMEVQDQVILVDSDRVAPILRHIPRERLEAVLIDVSGMSKADYIVWYDENIKSSKPVNRHAITVDQDGAILQDYEVESGDPTQGMDADIVIDGGRVLKGEVVKER